MRSSRGVAVAGVDAAVHAIVGTDVGVLLVQRGGGHVARGNAPAVVDGAYALRLDLRIHVQGRGVIRIGAVQRARAIEIVGVQAPLVVGVAEHAGGGEVRTERHAVHALAIAVGADGAQYVGAMVGIAEAVRLAGSDQACCECGRNARAETIVVVAGLFAAGLFAGAGTCDHTRRRTVGADGDAGGIASRKLRMRQRGARIEQRQAYALAGQAACIGVIRAHRSQAPIGVEFVAAPAGGIAGVPRTADGVAAVGSA